MTTLETMETRRERVARDLAHAQTMLAQAATDRAYQRHLRRVATYRATLANLALCIADTLAAPIRSPRMAVDLGYVDDQSGALIPARLAARLARG